MQLCAWAGALFSVYLGNNRCERVVFLFAPSAMSVRISDRRGTCPEPSVLSSYRRLSRTFIPRWVDLPNVLLVESSLIQIHKSVFTASVGTTAVCLQLCCHCFDPFSPM